MSEKNGPWIAGKVYIGEVSEADNKIIFHGFPMKISIDYTPNLKRGVEGAFEVMGGTWTQKELEALFVLQNKNKTINTKDDLLSACMFELEPVMVATDTESKEGTGLLDVEQVLNDFKIKGGGRTKRKINRKSKRKSRR